MSEDGEQRYVHPTPQSNKDRRRTMAAVRRNAHLDTGRFQAAVSRRRR